MTHNEGGVRSGPSQADFVGVVALVLMALTVLAPIVILIAATTVGG
jgi:hypothetical protein